MIAGPSNFPVRRMEKYNNWEHNKLTDLLDFRKRALKAIHRKLHPEVGPIRASDSDATQRLEAKIHKAEAAQKRDKGLNSAYRKAGKPEPEDVEGWERFGELTGLKPETVSNIRVSMSNRYSWEMQPVPGYVLKNRNANIRRLKKRLEQVATLQASPEIETESNGIRLEDCPSDNRVRLFFPGKPDSDIRSHLKRNGFRWAPSLGCWQAYRNPQSLDLAKAMLDERV